MSALRELERVGEAILGPVRARHLFNHVRDGLIVPVMTGGRVTEFWVGHCPDRYAIEMVAVWFDLRGREMCNRRLVSRKAMELSPLNATCDVESFCWWVRGFVVMQAAMQSLALPWMPAEGDA